MIDLTVGLSFYDVHVVNFLWIKFNFMMYLQTTFLKFKDMMQAPVLLIITLVSVIQLGEALYFPLFPYREKCIWEDIVANQVRLQSHIP